MAVTAQSLIDRIDGESAASLAANTLIVAGLIGLAIALSKLFWLAVAGASHQVSMTRAGSDAALPSVQADYSLIERVTPFQSTIPLSQILAEPEATFSSAPETDLDLTLHGIIVSGEDAGRAMISSANAPQKRYAIGDAVDGADGAKISRIFADTVLLDRAGVVERLEFSSDGALGAIQIIGEEASASEPAPETSSPAPPATEPTTSVRGSAENPIAASSRLSRSELLLLAESIRLDPNTGDAGSGYSLFPTRNAELFNRAGLAPGDIAKAAGGITLADEADFSRLMSQLDETSSLELLLIRNGEYRLLTIGLYE